MINYYDFLSLPPNAMTIRNRVRVIRNHFISSERLFDEEKLKLNKKITEAYSEDMSEEYQIELHFNEHFFWRVHRVSTLLIAYSLLENLMAKICKYKLEHLNDNDINGYGVLPFKVYLENKYGVNFAEPKIEKYWSKVLTLNKLRNSLAHSEGDLEQYEYFSKKSCDKLRRTINGTKGISLYSNTIMISKDYVIESINAIEGLLLELSNHKYKNSKD